MKHYHFKKQYLASFYIVSLTLIIGFSVTSCKQKTVVKDAPSEKYAEAIAEKASDYNEGCPKELANGTKLQSVEYSDHAITFRLSISDESIALLDFEKVRDSLIHNMGDDLKEYLIKGKCDFVYKFVSPNDSASVQIVPDELEIDNEE